MGESKGTAFPIWLARVYDPPEPGAGARLLVDRLWPRGLSKASLHLDFWARDAAPSTVLRKWFHADPSRWPDFGDRYRAELRQEGPAVAACLDWCRRGPVVLLTAAHDPGHSHAVILRDHLATILSVPPVQP